MCHAFLNDSRFHQLLWRIDQDIAATVRTGGCSCGGVLHSACYRRKTYRITEEELDWLAERIQLLEQATEDISTRFIKKLTP